MKMIKPYLIKDLKECSYLLETPVIEALSKAYLRDLLHPSKDLVDVAYSLTHFFLEPGSRTLKLRFKKSSELLFILEGEAKVFIDGDEVRLSSQQTLFISAGTLRYVCNSSENPLKFLSIANPPFQINEVEVLEEAIIADYPHEFFDA